MEVLTYLVSYVSGMTTSSSYHLPLSSSRGHQNLSYLAVDWTGCSLIYGKRNRLFLNVMSGLPVIKLWHCLKFIVLFFWPTVLSVVPLVHYVVCLSVCLSVCRLSSVCL